MTRAVIATRLFPPEVSAGAFRLGALARALVRRGTAVRVVTTRPPRHAPPIDDAAGVDVSRWPVLRDRGGNVRGYIQYLSFDAPLLGRLIFRRWDVAVAESPPTTGLVVAWASRIRRAPFVYYAADVWTDGVVSMGAPAPVVTVMRAMERAVLRRAAAIISVSDEVTERLQVLGAAAERIETVGNGVDTTIFTPSVTAAASVSPYFVYTGTMSEWQQPEIFVRAFAQVADEVPDLRVKFFGQGVREAAVRTLADELVPGRVDFGGVVSPQEAARWIRGAVASLVSIVPGIGYDFARPTKTYAAAAVGTAVLFAGPEPGAALIRDGALGHAVPFTAAEVAVAMRRLLEEDRDAHAAQRRVERGRWAAENVSLDAVAGRVATVVSRIAGTADSRLEPAPERNAGREGRTDR